MVHFKVYQDTLGGWRWRLIAANNYIVAVSSESYDSKQGAVDSADWVRRNGPTAPIF